MTKKKQVKVVLQPQTNKKKMKVKKEITRLGGALRALGGLGGSTLGAIIGQPTAGGAMGTSLGAALSKWLGSGDYQVSSNSLVNSLKASGSIPMMHQNGQSIIVRHKEFLGQINGTSEFSVKSYNINPGLSGTFPWLHNIAANYQEYRVRGMIFHYIPTSGNVSTTGQLGSVMMQTSYRATDTPPLDKIELLNEYWATECKPSEPFCHPIECDPKENPFNIQYIRSGSLPANENALMYDLGVTHVATSGCPGTNAIGDLWVTYEIELKKPIIRSSVASNTAWTIASFDGPKAGSANIFDAPGGTNVLGPLPMTYSGDLITFPIGAVGDYTVVVYLWNTNTFNSTAFGSPTLTNCVFNNRIYRGTSAQRAVVGSQATNIGQGNVVFTITIPDGSRQATARVNSTLLFATDTFTKTTVMVFPADL
nr:structural protein [Tolivirales sp.]